MIKIRLARHGAKKKPFYQIIVSDVRSARNGKFIERIGYFNPFAKKNEKKIHLSTDRVDFWIKKGAQKSSRFDKLLIEHVKNVYHTQNDYK
ncbi:30S ribosomal protein S16 [Buchnera aphidicola]|uniref:Small ribosomal subunit protein bS16 n=1 Tax=Buchnera aphidicola (Cinara cf. splendens/pseudotsugae 3390) TaxID=2518980 RepID=A0A451CWZ5_9GAMM|nr:30S ribosomal protein S16 [Buchnera aphidicola]VFP77833.1 30S ribosomal protein S16 [Buchnera aphidicola (Cinara cf. splendens/pseudotsugae 3390)]